jgi:hypothetical protein
VRPKENPIRTEVCERRDGEQRLAQAKKFLELADVVATERDNPTAADGAASLAVLAGIAASDAACCVALGRRSRGQKHADAGFLLKDSTPGGDDAAKALARLLAIKDKANYGIANVSRTQLDGALKQATKLVGFAEIVMRR